MRLSIVPLFTSRRAVSDDGGLLFVAYATMQKPSKKLTWIRASLFFFNMFLEHDFEQFVFWICSTGVFEAS